MKTVKEFFKEYFKLGLYDKEEYTDNMKIRAIDAIKFTEQYCEEKMKDRAIERGLNIFEELKYKTSIELLFDGRKVEQYFKDKGGVPDPKTLKPYELPNILLEYVGILHREFLELTNKQ